MPLDDCQITIERQVKWGEMDAFNHINNVAYFRYFEDVRIAHFDALQVMQALSTTGVGPILAHTECRFRVPLQYPDDILIGSRIDHVEADRFVMHYQVYSQSKQAVAATGSGRIVFYDYNKNEKASIPEAITTLLGAS